MGVKGRLWLLLYNWYQDMLANVVLNGKMSRDIEIKQSVRQGSILGPRLYMLYRHDLAVHLLDSKELFWTTVVNMFHVNVSTHLFNLCESE